MGGMQEAQTVTTLQPSLSAHQNLSFRPKLLAPLRVAQRRNPLFYLNSIPTTAPLLVIVFVSRMNRDKKRCHEKYDETNAYHPHMHAIVLPSIFKTTPTIGENGPGISPKNRDPLNPLVHRSQNEIVFAAFPHRLRK
jgi:hypothetical protein